VGGYFMAVKRYAEIRDCGLQELQGYRPVFRHYTEQNLLVSVMFYACFGMLFLGMFIARYRLELVLSFPLVAFVMCAYLALAFQKQSPAQHPERLYRQPVLIIPAALCVAVVLALLFIDVPLIYTTFPPSKLGL
jgi:amino acid transporter